MDLTGRKYMSSTSKSKMLSFSCPDKNKNKKKTLNNEKYQNVANIFSMLT